MRLSRLCILAPLALLACAATEAPSTENVDAVGNDANAPYYGVPDGIDVTRAYFNRSSTVQTSQAEQDKFLIFDLVRYAKVSVEVQAPQDKSGYAGGVYADLYRVTKTGKLTFIKTIDGSSGDGKLTFTSKNGGSYVLDVYQAAFDYSVQVDLSCLRKDGRCAPKPQPNDSCGGVAGIQCDAGLMCRPPLKGYSCPAPDWSGYCLLPSDQPCSSTPVCGCDGKDYATGCEARAAGVFIAKPVACSCNPTLWKPGPDQQPDGPLQAVWESGITTKDVTLTFDAKTSTYTASMDVSPSCTVKGQPCPTFPTQHYQANGQFSVVKSFVTLTGASAPIPSSLKWEQNCAGVTALHSYEDNQMQEWNVPDPG